MAIEGPRRDIKLRGTDELRQQLRRRHERGPIVTSCRHDKDQIVAQNEMDYHYDAWDTQAKINFFEQPEKRLRAEYDRNRSLPAAELAVARKEQQLGHIEDKKK